MGSRYLGIVSLERFLAVERYCESHQPASSTQPRQAPRPSGHSPAERPGGGRAAGRRVSS